MLFIAVPNKTTVIFARFQCRCKYACVSRDHLHLFINMTKRTSPFVRTEDIVIGKMTVYSLWKNKGVYIYFGKTTEYIQIGKMTEYIQWQKEIDYN